MWRRTPALFLALSLMAAPAVAQLGGFGAILGSEADDARFEIATDGPQDVVVIDADSNERPSSGEQVYLSTNPDEVSAGSVRLANPNEGNVGSIVQNTDAIAGKSASEVTGDLTYRDIDSDGVFERGEPVYWETNEASTSEVSNGDVVLAGEEAGTIVTGGHAVGQETTSLDGQFGYVDDNDNNGYNSGDRVFLDLRSDGWASIPDVHLTEEDGKGFGSMATVGDEEISYRLITSDAPTEFVYIDGNGDGDFDGDERVFLSDRSDRIFAPAIRLANPINGEHGSILGEDPQGEIGDDVESLSGTLSYDDQNGNNQLDERDVVIYDLNDGSSGEADRNDVILSGENAGQFVRQFAELNGNNLESAPGSIAYVDDNADDGYSAGDVVYLDADDDGFASQNDLQLTNHTMPEPVDTDGDGVEDEEDNCPDTANEDQADSDEDGEGDACDETPEGEPTEDQDSDDDGVADGHDDCPNEPGPPENVGCPEEADADDDGVPDSEDNCPETSNPDQADLDDDGTGDACDDDIDGDDVTNDRENEMGTDPSKVDTDGDGVSDGEDNCPETANPDQADSNDNGVGDACDEDTDGIPGPGAGLVAGLVAVSAVLGRRRIP